MRRMWAGLAMAVTLAAITAGGVVVGQSGGGGSDVANLWLDADGGTCVRQSTQATYSSATACDTMEEAYAAATSGDTIRVKAGAYGEQFFAGGAQGSQGSGTKTLSFVGEDGASVDAIHIGSPNLTFDNVDIDADGETATAGTALFENGCEAFTFKNASIGDTEDSKGALIDCPGITFDNVDFHDVLASSSEVHNECIQANWVGGLTIRDSSFTNCATMDLSFGFANFWCDPPADGSDPACDGPPASGVTLENNTWAASRDAGGGCCGAFHLALFATQWNSSSSPNPDDFGEMTDWVIRNNDFDAGSDVLNRLDAGSGNTICGNTGNVPDPSWDDPC